MEAQIEGLRHALAHGFSAVNQRLDDLSEVGLQRHEENINQFRALHEEQRKTNGTVIRHDEQIKTLYQRIFGGVGQVEKDLKDIDKVTVTVGTLGKLVTLVFATIAATYWVLTFLGFHR